MSTDDTSATPEDARGVMQFVKKLRDAAAQAGHYGAWSGGVLLEQSADEIARLTRELKLANGLYDQLEDAIVAEGKRITELEAENAELRAKVKRLEEE